MAMMWWKKEGAGGDGKGRSAGKGKALGATTSTREEATRMGGEMEDQNCRLDVLPNNLRPES
jgi:hypothetical protein